MKGSKKETMRVIFCIRKNYKENIAGDSVQLITTADYLRGRGVTVDINSEEAADYSDYDIIHLFNLTRISETYDYFRIAKKSKKTIVITPIYWELSKYYEHIKSPEHIAVWEKNKPFRSEILNTSTMIYPSSKSEEELIRKNYGESLPCTVIYNSIDKNKLTLKGDCTEKSFILCAARICLRKNQLALAKACAKLGEKLVLAGEVNNRAYLRKCLSYGNVEYKGFLNNDELIKLYQSAKLHVLCSFVETPGLSSMESAACGCNIVTTSEGSAKEYFDDMAVYCNPYNEEEIYASVLEGIESTAQPRLQKHILNHFNSEKILQKLYESYLKII